MTICIASINNGKAVMAADSLIVKGNNKVKRLKNFSKIFDFGTFLLGLSGDYNVYNVIKELQDEYLEAAENGLEKKKFRIKNLKHATKLGKLIYSRLRDNLECSLESYNDKDDEEGGVFSELLILTKDSIYTVDSNLTTLHYENYAATGSGEDLAIGALSVLWKEKLDLKKTLNRVIEMVIDNNTSCGNDIHIKELK